MCSGGGGGGGGGGGVVVCSGCLFLLQPDEFGTRSWCGE